MRGINASGGGPDEIASGGVGDAKNGWLLNC